MKEAAWKFLYYVLFPLGFLLLLLRISVRLAIFGINKTRPVK